MIIIDNRIKKNCPNCGKEFSTKFPNKIYCKKFCAEQADTRRKRKHPPFNQLMCEAKLCGMSFKRYTAALRAGYSFDDLMEVKQ